MQIACLTCDPLHKHPPSFYFIFFLHASVIDIDQLKLIMMLVGTPGPELLMKISSDSVSVKRPIHLSVVASSLPCLCVALAVVRGIPSVDVHCSTSFLQFTFELEHLISTPVQHVLFFLCVVSLWACWCLFIDYRATLFFQIFSSADSQAKVTLLHSCLFILTPCAPPPPPTPSAYSINLNLTPNQPCFLLSSMLRCPLTQKL